MQGGLLVQIDGEKVAAARRASGLTIEKAASICGISKPSYISREENPMSFRVHELEHLYAAMTDTAKPILHDAVLAIFLCEDMR